MRHLWVQGDDRPTALDSLPGLCPPVRAHRRIAGPYTAAGAVLRELIPDALRHSPGLVSDHDLEVRAAAPDLRDAVPARRGSIAAGLPKPERILVPAARRTLRISNGLTELIRDLVVAGGTGHSLTFLEVRHADLTDQEFLATLIRRTDPRILQVIVCAPAGSLLPPLSETLDRHARAVVPANAAAVTSSDDLPPEEHDRMADELFRSGEIAPRLGAVPYHRCAGTDNAAAVQALEFAVEWCFEEGFHHAVAEFGRLGLMRTDPAAEPDSWWNFAHRTATALASLDREEEAHELFDQVRLRSTDPERHSSAAYSTAMLLVRHHDPARRDLDRARALLNQAIAISTLLPDPEIRAFKLGFDLNAKALIEARKGRTAEARSLVNEAIALADDHLAPGRHPVHRLILKANRAQLKIMDGDLDGALTDFNEVIDADPGYPDYYIDRGNLLFRLGRTDDAVADYESAIRVGLPFPEPYFNRAEVRFAAGDLRGALTDLDHAVELDPDFADARINRAGLLAALGEFARAMSDVQDGLRLRPEDPRLLCVRGQAEMAEGDHAAARADFDAAIAIDASVGDAWACRGVLNYRDGEAVAAVSDLTRALELEEQSRLRFNRAIALRACGRADDAAADLARAFELDPRDDEIRQACEAAGIASQTDSL